jgi:ankyrin repeat protein
MKKFILQGLLFVCLVFVNLCAGLDVSTVTPQEIRLATAGELRQIEQVPEDLLEALQAYHDTRRYTLSLNEFFQTPNAYINRRIEALKKLQYVVPDNSRFDFLSKQIECKLAYLEEIPDMEDSRTTRMELKYRRMAEHGVEMCEAYSFELLDPLHRVGPEVKVYIDTWLATDIPNYFIFLETVEYDPLLNKFCPFENQVKYYKTEDERKKHLLEYKDGLCYLNGIPFDTGRSISLHADEPGIAIFTVGLDREIYVNSHEKYRIHHSSEFAGGEVIGAGELTAVQGKIIHISNKSGHYSPKHKEMMDILSVLNEKLGSLSGIELEMFQYTKNNQKYFKQCATFNAQQYFDNNGICLAIFASGDWSPLHVAVWNNHLELAESAFYENIDKADFQGNTPLHLAIIQGHQEWARILLNHGARPDIKNDKGETPLHLASYYNRKKIASLLLEKIEIVDEANQKGQTPLHYAAIGGAITIFEDLIRRGADPYHTDLWNNHLFHFAVSKGNTEFLIYLLESDYSGQINQKNNKGATPLHFAAAFGDMMSVHLILSLGFDPLEKDLKGRTALHYSVKFGNEQTARLFLNMNDDELIQAKNDKQMTTLHYAAKTLPHTMLQQLIAHGLRVNSLDNLGKTPLFYAIDGRSSMSLRNLKYLLMHGGHTDIYDYHGQALIHYAASRGAIGSMRRILTSSNDLELLDRNGRTALEIARSKNYKRMEKYILDHSN